MTNIKLLNKIAACGTSLFDDKRYNVGENVENPAAIMVRSAAMHDMEFGDELLAIAVPVQASTTFRSINAPKRALSCSIRRAQTQTP